MRGIAVARVEAVGGGGAHLLLRVSDLEGRSLIDRRGERPVLFGEAGAAAHRLGFLTKLMLLHLRISCRDAACRVSIRGVRRGKPRLYTETPPFPPPPPSPPGQAPPPRTHP